MNKLFDLTGQVGIVTGAAAGIGAAIAGRLAAAGATVVVVDRLLEKAQETAATLDNSSFALEANVADNREVVEAVNQTLRRAGRLDILVNNAGIAGIAAPIWEQSDDDWQKIIAVNMTGVFNFCRAVIPHMRERKYGRIVNIASLSSFVGLYEVAAYGASKAAVASLTRSLAIEWARHGVCVNAIVPGLFVTELNAALLQGTPRGNEFLVRTPMGRFGNVEELVGAAVFLASDAASFVTGHLLTVVGGFLASGVNQ